MGKILHFDKIETEVITYAFRAVPIYQKIDKSIFFDKH